MAFLKMQGLGESLSGAEIDELLSIASTCPEEGGSVMHFASTVYSANTRIPLPITQCANDESGKVKMNNGKVQTSITPDVGLFPNPGRDELIVSTNTDNPYTILIQSLDGKILTRQISSDKQQSINTTDLLDGMYIVRIISDDGLVNSTLRWLKSSNK